MAAQTKKNPDFGVQHFLIGLFALLWVLAMAGPAAAAVDQDGVAQDEVELHTATIGGAVADAEGLPVADVSIDLFTEARASYLQSTTSSTNGVFTFGGIGAGCYVVTFIAPDGANFENGTGFFNVDVCVTEGQVVDDLAAVLSDSNGSAQITAEVRRRFSGQLVGGVAVDLFTSDEAGNRVEYLRSTSTRADGDGAVFTNLEPGCYTLTYIAPQGSFFSGSEGPTPWENKTGCVDAGESLTRSATLDGVDPSADLRIIVVGPGQDSVGGVAVDLFSALGDGSRSTYIRSQETAPSGSTTFRIAPGCYIAVVIAPPGDSFPNGTAWQEVPICLETGSVETVIVELA